MKSFKTSFVLTLIATLAVSAAVIGCKKSDEDNMKSDAKDMGAAMKDTAGKAADTAKDAAVATKDAVTNAVSK